MSTKDIWNIYINYCVWRRQWQPTPVLLPGKSHGQRSLVGCSPWGRSEPDTTEQLSTQLLSCQVTSVVSDSVQPHRQQPTRLPCPWDSPGKNTGVGCHFLLQCMKMKSKSEVTQSCLTFSNPMDCSLPGSSVHGFSRQEYWSGVPLQVSLNKEEGNRRPRTPPAITRLEDG